MDGLIRNLATGRTETLDNMRMQISKGLLTPNKPDRDGNTILHVTAAFVMNSIKYMKEIIDAGADPNVVNKAGYTPLHYAVIYRNSQMVKELLQAGADVNARSRSGKTALHYAINNHRYECLDLSKLLIRIIPTGPDDVLIKMLLQHENINIDAADVYGETPLMWSVVGDWSFVVKRLLVSGANPNICNTNGQSPLHAALNLPKPNMDIVHLLLQNGADVHSLNRANQTPVDVLVNSIRNDESLNFAKRFVKFVVLHFNLRKNVLRSLERYSELTILRLACRKEVSLMKKQIIARKLTVHDFLLGCFNEDQFSDVCVEIHKPLVEILMTGQICCYLPPILFRIGKFSLWYILGQNISLKNDGSSFTQIVLEEVRKLGIKNLNLMNVSEFYIFKLIMKYST